jgi:hypothetical protein
MRQLVCLAVLVALCIVPLQTEAADGTKTYSNRNGGYSLTFPDNMRVEVGDWNYSINITDKNGEAISVKVLGGYFDSTKTIETMSQSEISDFTLGMVQNIHVHPPVGMLDFTVDDFGVTRLGSQKAVYIASTAEWDNAGKTRQSKYAVYCLLRKGDLYIITTDAPLAAADGFKTTFQKTLDSFKLL